MHWKTANMGYILRGFIRSRAGKLSLTSHTDPYTTTHRDHHPSTKSSPTFNGSDNSSTHRNGLTFYALHSPEFTVCGDVATPVQS